jgi:hypothetical protein
MYPLKSHSMIFNDTSRWKNGLILIDIFMKMCPSQSKEMIQIGVLCYSSILTFHDDLKLAILSHPLWTPKDANDPPIFDIYVSELNAPGKKSKMLFVSSEKSKQEEVTNLFKNSYDGTKKSYPNGSMMLFIPIANLNRSNSEFCSKIIFNHEKFIGDEALFSIGGFQNLNNLIRLKNGKSITI